MDRSSAMKVRELVAVTWADATSSDPWEERSEIINHCNTILTVGILIDEDEAIITIGLNHDLDSDSYSCYICIPKTCIIKQKSFSLKF